MCGCSRDTAILLMSLTKYDTSTIALLDGIRKNNSILRAMQCITLESKKARPG